MLLGNKIAELRKEKGMTQEALANALGVSNQAVSKWEANQSCPDIQLLPQIADFFGVSLDSLFGREVHQEEKDECDAPWLPWEDDGKLRAVIYIGKKLVHEKECSQASEIVLRYEGPALDIISSFSVTCEDVEGNVTANGSVTCDAIGGNVKAAGSVTCDDINGNVEVGGNITCDEINGNASAGGNIICDELSGEMSAGGTVVCDGVKIIWNKD